MLQVKEKLMEAVGYLSEVYLLEYVMHLCKWPSLANKQF